MLSGNGVPVQYEGNGHLYHVAQLKGVVCNKCVYMESTGAPGVAGASGPRTRTGASGWNI